MWLPWLQTLTPKSPFPPQKKEVGPTKGLTADGRQWQWAITIDSIIQWNCQSIHWNWEEFRVLHIFGEFSGSVLADSSLYGSIAIYVQDTIASFAVTLLWHCFGGCCNLSVHWSAIIYGLFGLPSTWSKCYWDRFLQPLLAAAADAQICFFFIVAAKGRVLFIKKKKVTGCRALASTLNWVVLLTT